MNIYYEFIGYVGSVFTNEKGDEINYETIKDNFYKLDGRKGKLIYQGNSYDDYVTGGGTNITNKYYKDEFQKIKEFGIFWNIIYEEVEADVILV